VTSLQPLTSPVPIASATAIGTVRLTVIDLARSRTFYETALGLRAAETADGTLAFGAPGGPALLELAGDGAAPPLDRRATGLYHFAILVPTRRDLAAALLRLARARWPLSGASDHLVSEALYLDDPDGNGIEIYRDRPRPEWPRERGALQMATLPLDLDALVSALADGSGAVAPIDPTVPLGTAIGHVHLQVAELAAAQEFYSEVLGFDATVRGYPGALFVSAGGYHHHIGLNTWHSAGSAPPPPGAVGLRWFDVLLPDQDALAEVTARLDAAGLARRPLGRGTFVRDPSGNGILLRA
jgi:catechol 2,3-dioxygenase